MAAEAGTPPGSGPDRGSLAWHWLFRFFYRVIRIADPAIRAGMRLTPRFLPRAVELDVAGRRSGRTRRVLVTLLTVSGGRFLGHPNGPTAWTMNLEAAGTAGLTLRDGTVQRVIVIRLRAGPEREAVIQATWSQQPTPANLVYWLARGHVRRVGVYYRLIDEGDLKGEA